LPPARWLRAAQLSAQVRSFALRPDDENRFDRLIDGPEPVRRPSRELDRLARLDDQVLASESDRLRLDELKVSLDEFWDLLRQRRALREAGRDPDAASVRPPGVVDRYPG
jgi:hypothetical protein